MTIQTIAPDLLQLDRAAKAAQLPPAVRAGLAGPSARIADNGDARRMRRGASASNAAALSVRLIASVANAEPDWREKAGRC